MGPYLEKGWLQMWLVKKRSCGALITREDRRTHRGRTPVGSAVTRPSAEAGDRPSGGPRGAELCPHLNTTHVWNRERTFCCLSHLVYVLCSCRPRTLMRLVGWGQKGTHLP